MFLLCLKGYQDLILNKSGRHTALSKICSLSVSSLRLLLTEADKVILRQDPLYETATLVDCYARHVLRPHIDKESDHKRRFLKINFINKGIHLIDLPSILNDKTITSLVPSYFCNQETPMICYKYNKPIRNVVFNYNQVVSDHDILINAPNSCYCSSSEFCYSPAGHVITGNLKIIPNTQLRNIVSKGPKYRLPNIIDFYECFSIIKEALQEFSLKWCKRENTSSDALLAWNNKILRKVEQRILFYKSKPELLPTQSKYSMYNLKNDIKDIHDKFVLVPADKASNNIIVI